MRDEHAAEEIGSQVVLQWHQTGQYHLAQNSTELRKMACCPTGGNTKCRGKEEKSDIALEEHTNFDNIESGIALAL
ncbi:MULTISPECIES: hypothetical protein [unclassified Janthinobacterium]|uniref:hypothetical protein n=1 Tax=unclassified Janthinobacterium TaxID=2610881 RepID=UPI00160E5D58|nr:MULTISPECIES: hypothetical protein [unclassified Janthinobacterium]MBB5607671.1 hypothetical protein [Janthinobacterium sp. S3T4]MBB5613181.1 hypothetical protein [Janthinobacterium sp. S3M3]